MTALLIDADRAHEICADMTKIIGKAGVRAEITRVVLEHGVCTEEGRQILIKYHREQVAQ
jgi:hypothetical protein